MPKKFALYTLLALVAVSGSACKKAAPVPVPKNTNDKNTYISVHHDDQHKVTCWTVMHYNGAGISCLPDKDVVK